MEWFVYFVGKYYRENYETFNNLEGCNKKTKVSR